MTKNHFDIFCPLKVIDLESVHELFSHSFCTESYEKYLNFDIKMKKIKNTCPDSKAFGVPIHGS